MRFLHCCFCLRGKLVEHPRLLLFSPRSLNNFSNFARYASRRCTGHATMSTERGNNPLIPVRAPFLVLAIAPNQKSLGNMAINGVGRKFENDLQTALKESLAQLFPVRGGGVLPIMAYTGRLRPKGVPFSAFRYIKG